MGGLKEVYALEEESEAILLRKILRDFKIVKRESFMKGEGLVLVKKGEFLDDFNVRKRGKGRMGRKM
ncbi:MAG: hypothetical protein AAB840_02830 [Patescibacteria group bacterium]